MNALLKVGAIRSFHTSCCTDWGRDNGDLHRTVGDGYNNALRWAACSEGLWDIGGFSHEQLFRGVVGQRFYIREEHSDE
jgi:hypothetical protein